MFPDSYLDKFAATGIAVSLQSNTTGEIFASVFIPAQSWNVANWTHVDAQIVSTISAPNVNNTLVFALDAMVASGQSCYFNQVSLFGDTFKGYENGLWKDLAQNMYDLKPKFLRWPGGKTWKDSAIRHAGSGSRRLGH